MSGELLVPVAAILAYWCVVFVGYAVLLCGADLLITAVTRHRRRRRLERQARQRVAAEQAESVQRIGTAFGVAQQLLRAHATHTTTTTMAYRSDSPP